MLDEAAWLACGAPFVLYLDRCDCIPRPERKLRLFACGCCRQIWNFIADPRCRTAVEVAERTADDTCSEPEFDAAFDAVEECWDSVLADDPRTLEQTIIYACMMAIRAPSDAAHPVALALADLENDRQPVDETLTEAERNKRQSERFDHYHRCLADLFRDIFGNPFRPITLDRTAISAAAVELAAGMYERGDFSAMRELGAALRRGGTCDPEILAHCESPGPHVKGCWVVDLVLGFENATPR